MCVALFISLANKSVQQCTQKYCNDEAKREWEYTTVMLNQHTRDVMQVLYVIQMVIYNKTAHLVIKKEIALLVKNILQRIITTNFS